MMTIIWLYQLIHVSIVLHGLFFTEIFFFDEPIGKRHSAAAALLMMTAAKVSVERSHQDIR